MTTQQLEFLESIAQVAANFTSIQVGSDRESLSLSFWTYQEISRALPLREEWDVNLNYIPFYGDWHDLFCLDKTTGSVAYLNDERRVMFQWENAATFISSLGNTAVPSPAIKPKLVSYSLSPELQARVRAQLNKGSA